MVDRILVGVDGSDGSRRALRWAAAEATAHHATLQAVTVWENPIVTREAMTYYSVDESKLAEGARGRLDRIMSEVAAEYPGVEIEPIVLEGDAAATLCERAADFDLLVVGSRGHGTFGRLFLGSVSNKCTHHSPCPVVVVPSGTRR